MWVRIRWLLLLLLCSCLVGEENFILMTGRTNVEIGPHLNERITPCSTFKIALSLMGFDSNILLDENTPIWLFQEDYDDFLESWKNPQTPLSWIKTSCVWYSRQLSLELGAEKLHDYLTGMEYGNQDISGGIDRAWLTSSLKISPIEQAKLIERLRSGKLPISKHAIDLTKKLLFIETLPGGWDLFGKTGWSGSTDKPDGKNEFGWFVGWIEKDSLFFPFAYNIRAEKIALSQRIPRVKYLLEESNITSLNQ